jgi:hypothetical protein
MQPVQQAFDSLKVALLWMQFNAQSVSPAEWIHSRSKGKRIGRRLLVFRSVMSDDVAANQVTKDASNHGIRGKVFASGDPAYANRGCERIRSELSQLVRVFRRNDSCQSPTGSSVA